MKRASIDLGTNTALLLVCDWENGRVGRVWDDVQTLCRLGEGVDRARELQSAAMERTLAALKTYATRVRELGVEPGDVVCVATSQARDARNGRDFFARVERATGFRFRILSGDEEARATFDGAILPGMDASTCAVVDIGGGSTEFMAKTGGQSLDVGSVRFTERFLKSDPVTDNEFWACRDAIDSALKVLRPWRKGLDHSTHLVGVAGTVTTLATMHLGLKKWDATRVDGVELFRGDVHRIVEELKWRTVEERIQMTGIEPKRADVLLAGALILWRAMETLEFPRVTVSTRGLRYGVLSL